MKNLSVLDWVALLLLVIGGINWGLVGLFQFDLVAALFGGPATVVSRVVYTIVGLSAVYVLVISSKLTKKGVV